MPNPTVSDHLAQVSEKLGRKDDALKYSAIAVAEGEVPSEEQDSDGSAVANSRERLVRLAASASNQISQDAQPWLEQQNSFAFRILRNIREVLNSRYCGLRNRVRRRHAG